MGLTQRFQRGAISERQKRRWFRAIDNQELDTLRTMLDQGFDLRTTWHNARNGKDLSALDYCVVSNRRAALQAILHHAKPDLSDPAVLSPDTVYWGVRLEYGHMDCAMDLARAGAPLNYVCPDNGNLLHALVICERSSLDQFQDIVSTLVLGGVDPEQPGPDGLSVRTMVEKRGNEPWAAAWLKLFDELRVQACVDGLEKDTPGVSTPKSRPRL